MKCHAKSLKNAELDNYFLHTSSNLKKTPPLPIVRRSIPNCQDLRLRIVQKGHKFFSKFVASGEDTLSTLNKIAKSKTLKYISSFEFDPYFREDSCIKPLIKAFKKFRYTKKVDLVIRRVNSVNETESLGPLLYKIQRMTQLKVELPKTLQITEQDLINIAKFYGRCYSLKRFEFNFVDIIASTAKSDRCYHESQRRLIHLEEIKSVFCFAEGSIKDEFEDQTPIKYLRAYKLKRIETIVGIHSEWNMMVTENQDSQVKDFMQTLPQCHNLREFKVRLIRHHADPDACVAVLQLLSRLIHLQHIYFEFITCSVTDFVVVTIASALMKMPYLKEFTLKVIQPYGFSVESIQQFVVIVSRIPNLQKLSFYFRKLPLQGEAMKEFAESLQQMSNNVQCSYFNQSLSVCR